MESTKKILIATASFYPEQSPRSFRATELAIELARLGHEVTVLTPKLNEHLEFERNFDFKISDLGIKRWKEIDLHGKGILLLAKRIIRRMSNLLFEYPSIEYYFMIKRKLKKEFGYDAIISIAVPFPIHWGVSAVWNSKGEIAKTWIADCGDPYMYATSDTFRKPFYFHYFENKFLRKANHVIVPFEDLKFKFNDKFRHKFAVIPQGFRMGNIELATYIKNKTTTFVYAGLIIPGRRDPFELLDYLIENEIDFKFILYTQCQHHFNKYKEYWDNKIIFKEHIKRDFLLYEMSKADFLVNIMERKTNGKTTAVPSKLIDYRLTQRPIFNYEQGSMPQDILYEFFKEDYTNQYIDPDFERYYIENVAQHFLQLLETKI